MRAGNEGLLPSYLPYPSGYTCVILYCNAALDIPLQRQSTAEHRYEAETGPHLTAKFYQSRFDALTRENIEPPSSSDSALFTLRPSSPPSHLFESVNVIFIFTFFVFLGKESATRCNRVTSPPASYRGLSETSKR